MSVSIRFVPALASVIGASACVAVSASAAGAANVRADLSGASGNLAVFAGTGSVSAPTVGKATSSALGAPLGVAVDANGNVYIADAQANVVEKVTTSGDLSIYAGTGTAGAPKAGAATDSPLDTPQAVAVDRSGNLYIVDRDNRVVEKVSKSGILSVIAGKVGQTGLPTAGRATDSELGNPVGIAVDSSGDVFIADFSSSVVEKVSKSGILSVIAGKVGQTGLPTAGRATDSELGNPSGVAVDSNGDVLISDFGDSAVEKVSTSGVLSVIAGKPTRSVVPTVTKATDTVLNGPAGIVVDAAGNVFVAEQANHQVIKIDTTGMLTTVAGNGQFGTPSAGPATSSELGFPLGLAIDAAGNLYIADPYTVTVDEVFGVATKTPGTMRVTSAGARHSKTTLKLQCVGLTAQSCTSKVTLQTTYRVRSGRRFKSRTVTIATATVTLAGGQSRTLTISLNRTGQSLLKHSKKLAAKLAVTQGKQAIATRKLTLTAGR